MQSKIKGEILEGTLIIDDDDDAKNIPKVDSGVQESTTAPLTVKTIAERDNRTQRYIVRGTLAAAAVGFVTTPFIYQSLGQKPTKAVPTPRQTSSAIETVDVSSPSPSPSEPASTIKWVEVISASPSATPSNIPSIAELFPPSAEPKRPTKESRTTPSAEPTESATKTPTADPSPTESPTATVSPSPEQTPTPSATETASPAPLPAPSETEAQPTTTVSLNTDNPDSGADIISLQKNDSVGDILKRLTCEGCKYATLSNIQNDQVAQRQLIVWDAQKYSDIGSKTVHTSRDGTQGFSMARLKENATQQPVTIINMHIPFHESGGGLPQVREGYESWKYVRHLQRQVAKLQKQQDQVIVVNGDFGSSEIAKEYTLSQLTGLGFEVQPATDAHTGVTLVWKSATELTFTLQ